MHKIKCIEIIGQGAHIFTEPEIICGTPEFILDKMNKFCRELEIEGAGELIVFNAIFDDNMVFRSSVGITPENKNIHPRIFQWLVMRDIFQAIGYIGNNVNWDLRQFAHDHSFGYEKIHWPFLRSDLIKFGMVN